MLRAELERDVAARFRDFAELCSRFSHEIVRDTPEYANLEPEENAQLNLRIARTVFGKWSIEIMSLLYTGRVMGFQELRKALGRITSRVLSTKLTRMEELGLLRRDVLETRPPRVHYSLTEKGLRVAKLGEPVFLYLRMEENLVALPAESK